MKIKDETLRIGLEIIGKPLKKRTHEEKLWVKLHGGPGKLRGIKEDLDFNIKIINNGTKRKIEWPLERTLDPRTGTAKRIYKELVSFLNERTFEDLVQAIEIFREATNWKFKRKDYNYEPVEKIKKDILDSKDFFKISFPIPVEGIKNYIDNLKTKRKEWQSWHKDRIDNENNEKERLKLIKRYKVDSNTSFNEVKKIEARRIRKKLGIGENLNLELSKELIESINKNVKQVEGFLYIRTWKVSNTKWFKIGITNNLDRRESEQNVLPVAAETIATAKVASMDHAKSIEKSIHKVIKKYKIKDSNNRELFKLEPENLASLLDLFKKIDIRNK